MHRIHVLTCTAILFGTLASCETRWPWQPPPAPLAPPATAKSPAPKSTMTVTKKSWGTTPDGEVDLYTCTNPKGLTLKLTNYGARIVAMETPDREGKLANVTLGFDTLDGYLGHTAFFGCTTGRYANR